MSEILFEFLGEAVGLLVMAIGSVGFTVLGVIGEQAAVSNLLAGQAALGLWELFIASWALFVGVYLIGVKQFVPRISAILSETSAQ